MATIDGTETTLAEAYEQHSWTYQGPLENIQVSCTMRDVVDFLEHIHRGLLARYDVTPKAEEMINEVAFALRKHERGGRYSA
jgi:hypothetical protein